jgi:uncharacterized membrane protein
VEYRRRLLRCATIILFALFGISLFFPKEDLPEDLSLWLFILSSISAMVLVGLKISRPVAYRERPFRPREKVMGNPGELLETARRLWYSEKDAVGAEQILDEIMTDYPGSPEAKRAKAFRFMLGISAFITLAVVNDQRAALRAGSSYQLIESFFYLGTIIVVSAISYFLFLRKK